MVVKVNVSGKKEEKDKKPKVKTGLIQKIKNKFRVWQANFSKMPFVHKLILFILGIGVVSLVSVALVYSFVIVTTPGHEPIDTTYKLINAQKDTSILSSFKLPTPPEIKNKENPVNGELLTEDEFEKLNKRKPLFVMIENSTDARPQAGLSKADLVYESLVESGITRFGVVYWDENAKKVGPIRSIRTYYLDWSAEYDDPPVCNIGQAGYGPDEAVIVPEADALSYYSKYNVKSFGWYGRNIHWRDYDKYNSGIAWEHVAYTDTETLWEDAETLGWTGPADIEKLQYKKDAIKEKRPLTQEVEIVFLSLNSQNHKVKWVYDRDTNTYKRFLAEEPHIDENNNKQLSAKNVILQYTQYRPTGDKNGRIVLTTVDEGKVKIFRDGEEVEGTWKKETRTSRTKFYNSSGNQIKLNRGQIWIDIIPVQQNNVLSTIKID